MLPRQVIVLAIDRLGAGWLGPYGNTWLETPNFNRLAASALLCETVIADAPDLAGAYRAYWTGRHALEPSAAAEESLPRRAAEQGHRTILLTDDEQIAMHPLAAEFAVLRRLPPNATRSSARSIDETALFAVATAAAEALAQTSEPALFWIHARGMEGPWDAPLEMRNQFADEDDPTPPALVAPPSLLLPENFDPDELLGLTQAYAGQVALADKCLGLLLAALDEHPQRDQTLLIVTSPRGYPLGEHRRVGAVDPALYAELLQVPLLICFPGGAGALERTQQIVQTHCLFDQLVWGPSAPRGETAVSVGENQRSIRTPAWFLRESGSESERRCELFAKPDDRWEMNEVASRCSETAELLATRLNEFAAAAQAGRLAELPPLAEVLADVWR